MKILIFLIISLYSMMAFTQEEIKTYDIDTSICEGIFLYKTKFIPKSFYAEYKKMTGFDFKVVNPNRAIQEGDIIRFFRKPLRRLVYMVKKDEMYLLIAERGGSASGISCIFFICKDGNVSNMNFLINISTMGLDENNICEIIKNKEYKIDNRIIP